MSMDQDWLTAMRAKGHDPIMTDYGDGAVLDEWVISESIHNGPGCSACGWTACQHCESVDQIPDCTAPAIEGEFIVIEKVAALLEGPKDV